MENMRRLADVHRFLNGDERSTADTTGLTPSDTVTELAPALDLTLSLSDTLTQRRSHYAFAPQPLGAPELATLLRLSVGPQRARRLPDGDVVRMRMAPSAGGLPSIDTYALVRHADAVPPGIHRFDGTTLHAVWAGDPGPALRGVMVQPEFAERAPVTLALVARLDTTLGRYPVRHYRTLHVDTGIAAENLYLVATALGLACCAVSGFHDTALTELLRLPPGRFPVLLFPVGHQP